MAAPRAGMAVPQFPAVGLIEGVVCATAVPTATVDTGADTGTDTGTGNSIGSCGARITTGPAPPPVGFLPPALAGVGEHLSGLNGQMSSIGFPEGGAGIGSGVG